MPENRFYLDQPFKSGEKVLLQEKEAHHIAVMRKEVGETIELINGRNQLGEAKVLSLHPKKVEAEIGNVIEGKRRSREFILCQALCESSRLDLILEKSTELGVHEIWLFPADKSQKKECKPHQLERMKALLIAAMKQSGRLDLPPLRWIPSLRALRDIDAPLFFGDLTANAPLFYSCLKETKKLFFVIGPPSGFSDHETTTLRTLGAQGVALSEQVLRTETAALAAVVLGMHTR